MNCGKELLNEWFSGKEKKRFLKREIDGKEVVGKSWLVVRESSKCDDNFNA